eukprot:7558616-Alexandrium_andersonii.AAC.1
MSLGWGPFFALIERACRRAAALRWPIGSRTRPLRQCERWARPPSWRSRTSRVARSRPTGLVCVAGRAWPARLGSSANRCCPR